MYLSREVALASCLLAAGLLGQAQPASLVPLQELVRTIPARAGLGSGASAVRLVRFDPDRDLLRDVAILWSNGDLVFGRAPEIQAAFSPTPVSGVTGMAVIPAAHALNGTVRRDALLVVGNGGWHYLSISSGTSLVDTPMTPPAGWGSVVRLETCEVGNTCLLVGLDSNLRTLHLGAFDHVGIVDSGTANAAADVSQMVFVTFRDLAGGGYTRLAARTNQGVETWDLTGSPRGSAAAPITGSEGALTAFVDGAGQKLAWVVQSTANSLLRVYSGPQLQLEQQLTFAAIPGKVPALFAPVGIAPLAVDGSGTDALVVHQNSTPFQIILTKDAQSLFKPAACFAVSGLSYHADHCPGVVADMNNDDQGDFSTVLTSSRQLRIETGLPQAFQYAVNNIGYGSDKPDYVASPLEEMALTRSPNQNYFDSLEFKFCVPSTYNQLAGVSAQIVAWSQPVQNPAGPSYGDGAFANPAKNYVFWPLTMTAANPQVVEAHQRLNMWALCPGEAWTPNTQYVLLLRMIQRDPGTGAIIWSSPSQLVGMMVQSPDLATTDHITPSNLNYLTSLCSGNGPPYPRRNVTCGKFVGVMLAPQALIPHYDMLMPSISLAVFLQSSGSF